MANSEHIEILRKGSEVWNKWRKTESGSNPDLTGLDFYNIDENEYCVIREYDKFNFSYCKLQRGLFQNCAFSDCNFSFSNMRFSYLSNSSHHRCDFRNTNLSESKISRAEFLSCDFSYTELTYCSARETDFTGSKFVSTLLDHTSLIKTNFSNTIIDGVYVYGISAWDLILKDSKQQNILISSSDLIISVPNIELAQFISLLVNNSRIRDVIDTITSKVVLILGRFTKERKSILDEIKLELLDYDYIPVLFDFKSPQNRDLTETIITLASMSKFIIADITDPKSIPQELTSFIPQFPSVPVQPIILDNEKEYAMFEHFKSYPWVLKQLQYKKANVKCLVKDIVSNCEQHFSKESR